MIRALIFSFCMLSIGLAQPNHNVLIWQDGGTSFQGLVKLVQEELNTISTGRKDIQYQVLSWPQKPDGAYDLIVTLGPRTSQSMIGQKEYKKPTIIGTVFDNDIQRLTTGEDGGSGLKNLNYIRSPYDAEKDLAQFRKMRKYNQLAVLLDGELAPLVQASANVLDNLVQEDEEISLIPVNGESPEEVLNLLPKDCDAIYLLPLGPNYEGEKLSALLEAVSEAGLPSFAMLGSEWVEAGAMASRAASQSSLSLARRIALNALAILDGKDASKLPTKTTTLGEDFVINLDAVEKSQIYPSWKALGEARLINLQLQPEGTPVHLRGVIGEALAQNLSFKISQRETEAGQQDIRLALAEILPELSVSSNFSAIDQARSAASFGSTQPYTWAASAQLDQILFAEPLYANLRIQKLLQASRVASQDQTELDVVLQSAEAYFNILLAASVVRLQNKNVDNTRINLNLAKEKESVGYSGISEVYRWETQLSLNKIDLNDAQANFRSAQFNLNQVLNRPQDEPLALADAELGDSLLSILDNRVFTYLSDPGQLIGLSDFLVAEGRRNLPELKQIQLSLQAQERLLQSNKRAFYLPTLGLNAQSGYNIYQGGYQSTDPIPPEFAAVLPDPITGVTWSVGLGLNFPIYQGNSRSAQKQQTTVNLARLKSQQKDLQNQLELRIRSSLQAAGASFAEIGLAQRAAEAARKNLKIAQEGYREGVVPIAQLIDAQEALLQTEILASNAVYSFLLDYLRVERATGSYFFLSSPEEQNLFFQRARQFINQ
ncbi:MAG: TolC family protein [Bacteroidia bacterium]|nr:TolC family protein [Bacteroidia bacterium]